MAIQFLPIIGTISNVASAALEGYRKTSDQRISKPQGSRAGESDFDLRSVQVRTLWRVAVGKDRYRGTGAHRRSSAERRDRAGDDLKSQVSGRIERRSEDVGCLRRKDFQ